LFKEPLSLHITTHGSIGREGTERWVRGADDREVVVMQLIGPARVGLILGAQGLPQRLRKPARLSCIGAKPGSQCPHGVLGVRGQYQRSIVEIPNRSGAPLRG
jgi:hypothetical protein